MSISTLYIINLSKEFPALDHFDFIPRRGTSMMLGAGREHATSCNHPTGRAGSCHPGVDASLQDDLPKAAGYRLLQ